MKKTIRTKPSKVEPVLTKSILDAQQITVESFRLLKGSIAAEADFKLELIEGYEVSTDFDMRLHLKGKKVRSTLTITIKTESGSGQTGEASGRFELQYNFHVDNLGELTTPQKDGPVIVHPDLANAIASVTYSTTRGMLMARLQSTALGDFILPVVSPNELFRNKGKK